MNKNQSNQSNKLKLLLSTSYGLIYFVLSIIIIAFVIIFTIIIAATKSRECIWVLLAFELAYCITIFTLEIIRNKRKKAVEKKAEKAASSEK